MKTLIGILLVLLMGMPVIDIQADELADSFVSPQDSARPWVYWFPLNGNLTKAGITADLEAMARVGIGGVLYMEVDQGAPAGEADFAGPLWMEMIGHACREAKRLGLEINMHNDAGWNGSGGPWITPEMSMQKVVWSEVVVDRDGGGSIVLPQPAAVRGFYRDIAVLAMPAPSVEKRIADIEGKASYQIRGYGPLAAEFAEVEGGAVIDRERIVDLTGKMGADGMLNWSPPVGKWLVMRFGHTTTGKENHPAPGPGCGLECDKLSREAAVLHFRHLMDRIIEQNQAMTGQDKTLVGVHIDSWENGTQNWTLRMREAFRQKRGYDMLSFLPVYTGRIVDSMEVSERFLWDLRQTISELLIENYAGTFKELAHKNGLRLTIEAYGEAADDFAYAGQADEPMGEFWAWGKFGAAGSVTEMASAAHTYGKRILGAEAFTADSNERWQGHPANIKDLGDWAFCEGINRFVFHRYAAQPWLHQAPGMSMGPWGLHYERTQTWWEQSVAWHLYLARCQSLLQQGMYVADIVYLMPEGAPRGCNLPPETELAPHIRSGYGFDACSAEVVLTRMRVQGGRIVLPDGMSYRVLVLPGQDTMTPGLLAKIQELAEAGAMIVGPGTPPRKSPSLADMGKGDEVVRKNGAALWDSGKILTGKTAQQRLSEMGVAPDFSASPLLRYIHRRIGSAEVYFVANPELVDVEAVADFRVSDRQPELWWPDSGRMEKLVTYREIDGITRVPLRLEGRGSVFVVFRQPAKGIDPIIALRHEGEVQWSLEKREKVGQEIKIVSAIYGPPGDAARTRNVTQKLQDLIDTGKHYFQVAEMARGDDPAYGVVKTLTIEYQAGGQTLTAVGQDPDMISLGVPCAERPAEIGGANGKGMELLVREAGRYEWQTAGGKTKSVAVGSVPETLEIAGPWRVHFDPERGGPEDVEFNKLEDWSKRAEEGIKYYSGGAVYQTTFTVEKIAKNTIWLLDLGQVEVMAEVKLNGRDLGILWKPPYRVDIGSALRAGENRLEIKVVNLWINRLIGDENLPEDSDRHGNGTLKSWPEWVRQDKASPTGRLSFTSWRLWKKGDKPAPSGLIGPVTVRPMVKLAVDR